jgi:hypothetical protein
MLSEELGVVVTQRIEQPGGPLDVGEEEGDGAAGKRVARSGDTAA